MVAPIPAWLDRWIAGEFPLTELAAGRIELPSGRVIACDPLVSMESARPFTRAVPEGRHPVTLGLLEGEVALASVRFGRPTVARWEIARCAGDSDEGTPGYGVDSGTGCFADAQAAAVYVGGERARYQRVTQRLRDEGVDPDDPLAWHEAFEEKLADDGPDPLGGVSASIQKKRFASVVLDAESGGTLVAYSTGVGDGVYASYWGLDAKGRPMMLVTDFGLDDRREDRDEDDVREDEDEMDEDDDMDLDELEEWLERRTPAVEAPPAASPLLPRAEQLLKRWEGSGKLQLEDDCDRRALAEALLEKLVTLEGHRHLGGHLAEWLMERSEVADVFASDDELEADLRAP
jgi:hypothetical protein